MRENRLRVSDEEKQLLEDAREKLGWPEDAAYGSIISEVFGMYLDGDGK